MEAWEEFEELARRIAEELTPSAKVTRNEKLRGRSGVVHQCDVVVRLPAGDTDILCVIECKDTSARVDLDTVRGAFARIHDLNASGVIVSRKGFTTEAAKFAEAYGIRTYLLAEASSLKWAEQAVMPVIVTFVALGGVEFEFTEAGTGRKALFKAGADLRALRLLDTASNRYLTIEEILGDRWDELLAHGAPTGDTTAVDSSCRYHLLLTDGLHPVEIWYVLKPQSIVCYGRVALEAGRAFVAHRTQELHLGKEFQTPFVDLNAALRTWPRATSRSEVP